MATVPIAMTVRPAARAPAPPPYEAALLRLEQAMEQFRADLLSGNNSRIEADSQVLRQAVLDLSNQAPALQQQVGNGNSALKLRLQALGKTLAANRESLIRLSVVNARMLQTLLPAAPSSTYGNAPGSGLQRGRTAAAYTSKSV